jgi:2-polyprenyl-6-methoxyphenol hydroxylase-like FAD-dependent oxidoreductase
MTGPNRATVAVLGGGPAGASAALELARVGIDTVLIEQTDGSGSPIGECLAPSINPLLQQLGLADVLQASGAIPSHGNRSSWGDAASDRDFLREPFGHGWHLDRPAFNRALLEKVEAAGIPVLRHHRITSIERTTEPSPPLRHPNRRPHSPAHFGRGGSLCPPLLPADPAENKTKVQRNQNPSPPHHPNQTGTTSSPPRRPDRSGETSSPPVVPTEAKRSGGTSSPQRVSPQNPLVVPTDEVEGPTRRSESPPQNPFPLHPQTARVQHHSPRFRITTSSPYGEEILHASMLIDATGRRSLLARYERIRRRTVDSQIAAIAVLTPSHHAIPLEDATTVIEATPNGWWYAALLPDHRLVATWFTDPDILAKQGAWRPINWWNLLRSTELIAPLVTAHASNQPQRIDIAPAGSTLLTHPTGDGWIAAGDAAACYDPLSSHGIGSALASGRSAARAVAATLTGDPTAFPAYRDHLLASYTHYLYTRHAYYTAESRWPETPFWSRRHGQTRPTSTPNESRNAR